MQPPTDAEPSLASNAHMEEEEELDDDYEPSEHPSDEDLEKIPVNEDISNEVTGNTLTREDLESGRRKRSDHETKQKRSNAKKSNENENERKARIEELWNEIKADVKQNNTLKNRLPLERTIQVQRSYRYAGETIQVTETVSARDVPPAPNVTKSSSSTPKMKVVDLDALCARFVHKKHRLNTLEKSRLDWRQHMDQLGNAVAKQSQKSFLEKSAFLQQTNEKSFALSRELKKKQEKAVMEAEKLRKGPL